MVTVLDWQAESRRAEIADRCAAVESRSGRTVSVVVGTSINALGVVRALASERLPVVWLTASRNSFATASRGSSLVIVCSDIYESELTSNLEAVGALFRQRPVLFLTHDLQVKSVSAARDRLSDLYRFALPSNEHVERLLSKSAFRVDAKQAGLTMPESLVVHSAAEFEAQLDDARASSAWVVKPLEKSDAFEELFGKAIVLRDRAMRYAFAQKYARLSIPVQMEAMVEGPDSSVVFCLVVYASNGAPLSLWCGKKIRQSPPLVGSTASAEPLTDHLLREESAKFFEYCGMRGMGSLEFKRSIRDGRLYVIEPTIGRTDLQSEVAVVNGSNLPAVYYYDLIGDSSALTRLLQSAQATNTRKVWLRVGADFRSAFSESRSTTDFLRKLTALFRTPLSFAVFRWSDPFPFLLLTLYHTRGILLRTAKVPLRLAKYAYSLVQSRSG